MLIKTLRVFSNYGGGAASRHEVQRENERPAGGIRSKDGCSINSVLKVKNSVFCRFSSLGSEGAPTHSCQLTLIPLPLVPSRKHQFSA